MAPTDLFDQLMRLKVKQTECTSSTNKCVLLVGLYNKGLIYSDPIQP